LIHFFSINKEAPNNNCIDRSPKEVLWLNQGKLIVKIHLNQLKYVKTEKPYLLLNTVEKNYLYHQSLKNLLAELPQSCFIQIHRSTILNIKFIQEIRNKKNGDFEVVLTDLRVLKGSRRFRSELQEVLSTRLD
jgi:two-component system LytT family response regulator